MSIPVDIYRSVTETAGICIESGDEKKTLPYVMNGEQTGKYLHIEKSWSSRDRICFDEEDAIVKEDTHHQGICYILICRARKGSCEKSACGAEQCVALFIHVCEHEVIAICLKTFK